MAIREVASQFPFAEGKRAVTKEIDGPASYSDANKQIINASDVGLDRIENVIVSGAVVTATGAISHFVTAHLSKLAGASQGAPAVRFVWHVDADGAEVADTTPLNAQFFTATFFGY